MDISYFDLFYGGKGLCWVLFMKFSISYGVSCKPIHTILFLVSSKISHVKFQADDCIYNVVTLGGCSYIFFMLV
jgi:hypothetical protein